jgi:tetratricopeptide (TPR) repeat protein
MGLYLGRRKKFNDAIPHYKQAVELAPNNGRYQFNLGVAHYELKQYGEVARLMKSVIKLNPRDANAHNLLGYMWAEQGINLDEAIVEVKKAMDIEPNNGAYVDSLGWAYYKKGWLNKALQQLELATSLLPKDPIILDHLGDIYFDLKRLDEAAQAWEKSLMIDPKNESVRKKLAQVRKETRGAKRE